MSKKENLKKEIKRIIKETFFVEEEMLSERKWCKKKRLGQLCSRHTNDKRYGTLVWTNTKNGCECKGKGQTAAWKHTPGSNTGGGKGIDNTLNLKGPLNESYYCNGAGQNATSHPGCRKIGRNCINWREDPAVAGTMGYSQAADAWECVPNVLNVAQGGGPLSADDLTPSRDFDSGTRKPTKGRQLPKLAARNMVRETFKNILDEPTMDTPSADRPNGVYHCYECRDAGGWFSKSKCHHTSTAITYGTGRPGYCPTKGECEGQGCSGGEKTMRSMDMEPSLDYMMNEATANIVCEREGQDHDGDITNFKITPADGGKTINVDQNHELYQNIIRQISNSNGKIVKQLTKGQDSSKGNRLNEGPFCCWFRGGCCEWTHYLNLGYQDRAQYWEVRYPACCGNSSKGRCC